MEGYHNELVTKTLLYELSITGHNDKGFSLQDGVIRYKDKIWLYNHKEAQQAVLLALHNSGIWGHSQVRATYHKIKSLFVWPGMKQDIKTYVDKCGVCQQAKSENVKSPGLLQPLPIPCQSWQIISMDFIEGLPKSHRFDTILVVIEKFSKYGHFIPLSHPYTALTVAPAFVDHIYNRHELYQILSSPIETKFFTSNPWKELFSLTDITLNMSSSYHP